MCTTFVVSFTAAHIFRRNTINKSRCQNANPEIRNEVLLVLRKIVPVDAVKQIGGSALDTIIYPVF